MTTKDQAPVTAFKPGLFHASALTLCLLISACGGSGGGDTPSEGETNPNENDNSDNPSQGQNSPGDPSCQMSTSEAEMLAQVNTARSQARNCGSTAYPSTAALVWNCKLAQAAAGLSSDMAQNNFFSHTDSNGLGPGYRIQEQDYQAQTWGENIAAGYAGIDAAMTAWLNSPGHCRNIMDSDFKELGMAFAEDSGSDFGIYWTQVFAAPASANSRSQTQSQNIPQGRVGGPNVYRYRFEFHPSDEYK